MFAPLRLISFAAFALIWIQTAAAWHETEHALHGHPTDELVCEILSGTADQPIDLADLSCVSSDTSIANCSFHPIPSRVATRLRAYRSRAPPPC